MSFLTLASIIARELAASFLLNFIFLFTYIFVLYILKMQYEKYMALRNDDYLKAAKSIKELIKESAFFGAVAGFITSFAVIFLGITIEIQIFEYVFIMSIGLSLINIRYICFAYSGGILALGGAVLGISRIDIPSVLALVAILHFLESIMVYINAGKGSIPVLIKDDKEIAGAFFIQKFWPVPIVLFTFLSEKRVEGFKEMFTGNWPMLFQPEAVRSGALALGLGCIATVLGYSDVAITKTPEKKSRETSFQLLVYSIFVSITAVLSIRFTWAKFAGPVFAIGAHEFIVLYSHYREKHGKWIYKTVKRGVRVFDVLPDSHGQKMGIQRGDIILSINGKDVQTDEGMEAVLKEFPSFIWVDVLDTEGNKKSYEYKCYPGGTNDIGVMTVPRENRVTYNIEYFENISVLKNLVTRFKGI